MKVNIAQYWQCDSVALIQTSRMSDVFSNLCLFGKDKKKNSVSNQITVVGVKKALLLGI